IDEHDGARIGEVETDRERRAGRRRRHAPQPRDGHRIHPDDGVDLELGLAVVGLEDQGALALAQGPERGVGKGPGLRAVDAQDLGGVDAVLLISHPDQEDLDDLLGGGLQIRGADHRTTARFLASCSRRPKSSSARASPRAPGWKTPSMCSAEASPPSGGGNTSEVRIRLRPITESATTAATKGPLVPTK